jgi:hypothetical protein
MSKHPGISGTTVRINCRNPRCPRARRGRVRATLFPSPNAASAGRDESYAGYEAVCPHCGHRNSDNYNWLHC